MADLFIKLEDGTLSHFPDTTSPQELTGLPAGTHQAFLSNTKTTWTQVTGAGFVVTGPLTFSAGRKTLAGVSLGVDDVESGSVSGSTPTTLTLGTSTAGTAAHWTTSGADIEVVSPPTDATYTWTGCTVSDGVSTSDPFDLTINTVADQYTVTTYAEAEAAWDDAPTNRVDSFDIRAGVACSVVDGLGQSNMRGFPGVGDPGVEYLTGTFHIGDGDNIRRAIRNLEWSSGASGSNSGVMLGFARSWKTANTSEALIIVPVATSSSGISTGVWGVSGTDTAEAIRRHNVLMAEVPQATVIGMLWHQGESDAGSDTYLADIDAQFDLLRSSCTGMTASTPIVAGNFVPEFSLANANNRETDIDLSNIGDVLDFATCAPALGMTALDGTHFDGPSRLTMGDRYFDALAAATVDADAAPLAKGGTIALEAPDGIGFSYDTYMVDLYGPNATFTSSGTLPAGLTFNTSTGEISGTATGGVAAPVAFSVTLTNTGPSGVQSVTQDYTVEVVSSAIAYQNTNDASQWEFSGTGLDSSNFVFDIVFVLANVNEFQRHVLFSAPGIVVNKDTGRNIRFEVRDTAGLLIYAASSPNGFPLASDGEVRIRVEYDATTATPSVLSQVRGAGPQLVAGTDTSGMTPMTMNVDTAAASGNGTIDLSGSSGLFGLPGLLDTNDFPGLVGSVVVENGAGRYIEAYASSGEDAWNDGSANVAANAVTITVPTGADNFTDSA